MSDTITISRQEYQDLLDAREVAIAARQAADGAMTPVPEADVDAYLTVHPLAFWRKRRGYTQIELAIAAGISQPYVAQMESGMRRGDVDTLVRLARILGVQVSDLIVEEPSE